MGRGTHEEHGKYARFPDDIFEFAGLLSVDSSKLWLIAWNMCRCSTRSLGQVTVD